MNFSEMLTARRSIRAYKDEPVPMDTIREIIRDSTLAPSSSNDQPWKFVIVNSKEMIKRMSDESKKNILARIAANPDDYAKKYQSWLENESYNVFYNAPCVVIIVGQADERNLQANCALAASYFMMSATSRGLGTCWINLGAVIKDQEMLNELGIAGDFKIVAPITLGYPVKLPPTPKRNEPEILKIIT
jgi:nitroreductase